MTAEQQQAIDDLAYRFWSIHPKEIQDMKTTRQQFFAAEMTKLFTKLLAQEKEPS